MMYVMNGIRGHSRINPIVVLAIVVTVLISAAILITVAFSQEADAVTRTHTKKTVCIEGVCTTNETAIGNCPPSQCRSENSVTIK
jgi:uncharacterized low-complexity protein